MLYSGNRCTNRWQAGLLLFHVLAASFVITLCFDERPESCQRTNTRPLNIPDNEVESAFKEAEARIRKRKELEKRLVGEGRTVNKKIKTAESTHQQASSKPVIRNMENAQLTFQEVSNILTQKYNLTRDQVACELPKVRLRTASARRAAQNCVSNQTIECDANAIYRTADGTCNNLENPTWGSAFSCFNRILTPIYVGENGLRRAADGGELPPPRTISLNVHNNMNYPTNYVNHMYMFFGQLLDHDITFTPQSLTENNEAIQCCPPRDDNHPQCAEILISQNDPFYSRFRIRCLNFVRSALCPYCRPGVRSQINQVTTFIDASFVYDNSLNATNGLRALDGSGTLLTQNSQFGALLPQSTDPQNDQCSIPAQNQICFRAGDLRANQHPTLTSLHTVFMREHNRIAGILRSLNPGWNDETIFQEARKIVGAEMQVITFKEYLPVTLGNERMSYFNLWISQNPTSYNRSLDPTHYTEFSTAAFRFGHTMINTNVSEIPGRNGHQGHQLRDIFFYPFDLYTGEMDPLLRGGTRSPAQYYDRHMVHDVTNFLYRIQGNATGLDLASFNIQRGRDHGLQGYIEYVRFCSQDQIVIRRFEDLVDYQLMTQENMIVLRNNYGNVQDIDLFTGIISEMYRQGAVLGPTATCIVGLQFKKLKFGDRFYFQHFGQPGSFNQGQMNELKKASLAKILCDNTGIARMQREAMLFSSQYNECLPCNRITGINLEAWRK